MLHTAMSIKHTIVQVIISPTMVTPRIIKAAIAAIILATLSTAVVAITRATAAL